jgi:hypothetical protein
MGMVKSDIFAGLLVGMSLGLIFADKLAPHLAVIVILAVVVYGRMIHLK